MVGIPAPIQWHNHVCGQRDPDCPAGGHSSDGGTRWLEGGERSPVPMWELPRGPAGKESSPGGSPVPLPGHVKGWETHPKGLPG